MITLELCESYLDTVEDYARFESLPTAFYDIKYLDEVPKT